MFIKRDKENYRQRRFLWNKLDWYSFRREGWGPGRAFTVKVEVRRKFISLAVTPHASVFILYVPVGSVFHVVKLSKV